MEIFIFGAIILFVLIYNKTIDPKKFAKDNEKLFSLLKESDYEFLLHMKYGEKIDVDTLFQKRINNGLLTFAVVMVLFMDKFSLLNLVICVAIAYFAFKTGYMSLRNYYKAHLHQIDLMLPYYLKSLEILIQHYTVPVALARSIDDAPDVFKSGLKEMIESINAGDSTVAPYMKFANDYPVRDSMRMMRLLYRLGIGSQTRKQERLMMFSRSVSSLQNKAREVKYKERLEHMENQTMIMLVCTGVGVMILLLFSMLRMFSTGI